MRTALALVASVLLAASVLAGPRATGREPAGLHQALDRLAREGKFSGAVVLRGPEGVRFARGYGWADPYERRAFTPETPADSASLAKPVTSAAILLLVREGRIDLDAPVQRYLTGYPHPAATVRHLLSHSAGLALRESPEAFANKTNAELLAAAEPLLFEPGTAFAYCNLCSITLALLAEHVTGRHYLELVRERLAVPPGVTLRPQRLADWTGRAIGFRRKGNGELERFDSWEGELLYGTANLSISASQLAQWGSEWLRPPMHALRRLATTPARVGGHASGLTLGNWYCAAGHRRCHYLGHHEGFHHLLYWDADRRISLAMLSNNALSPALQQRLQRALVAFAQHAPGAAARELRDPLADIPVPVGAFRLSSGEAVAVLARGDRRFVRRDGIDYPAVRIGAGIRYVPGLDVYLAGAAKGGLRWLSLYEDLDGAHPPAGE